MLKKIGLSILVSVLLVTGCAPLGPNYKGVEVEVPATWKNTSKHSHTQMTQWWKIFNDPTLNALVQTTYAQNLDLKSAGLRIVQARAALGISEGLVYPQLQTLSGNAVRTRQNTRTFSATGLNFDLGWEMDIWGKYARGIESSEATVFASVASYHDIMVSVVAEVARNYINYRTYQERIAYAKRNIHIQERVTRITEIQFNSGNVSELDMQQARTQLYATRATLPALELAMIQSRNALAVLMGTHPDKAEGMLHLKKSSIDSMGKYISSKKSFVQLKDGDKDTVNITLVPTAKFNPYHKVDA
jgi:outer membrane protein TolC